MRIVTWNCERGPADVKLSALERLEFDVAVLQEIPVNPPQPVLWCGGTDRVGIGVIARPPFHARPLPALSEDELYAFPVRISGPVEFNLLAVWTQKKPSYVGAMLTALDVYRDFIDGDVSVVAGDFNSNSVWDKKRSADNHSRVVSKLAESSLCSAYHSFYDLPHGEETHPTLYWRRRQEDPFHIDYCFVPMSWQERILQVTVGGYSDWREYSDHSPLSIAIADMDC
jgi:hypothetical protein